MYKKCRECRFYTGEKRSIGRECQNPDKTWRTEYSMFKAPASKACTMFVPQETTTAEATIRLKEPLTDEQLRVILGEEKEKDPVVPFALTMVNKKTKEKVVFISEETIKEMIADIMDEEDRAYADFSQYADEMGYDERDDDFFHIGMKRAAEIVSETLAEIKEKIKGERSNGKEGSN